MDYHNYSKKNQLKKRFADYRFLILIIIGTIALFLGYIGFSKNGTALGGERTFFDNIYLVLGLFPMNSGTVTGPVSWELQIARFLVPAITGYAAFIAFAVLFNQQIHMLKLWFIRDHIIICGLGKKGVLLANRFKEQGDKVVTIDTDSQNASIDILRSSGVILLIGDGADPDTLQKARIHHAKLLISTIGDEGKNIDVAFQAARLSEMQKSSNLRCVIHISNPNLWQLLREKEINNITDSKFRLDVFNTFDRGAALMLNNYLSIQDDNDGWPESPNFVLIGMGKLGQSLITHAALRWMDNQKGNGNPLRFKVIDLKAEQNVNFLSARFPYLKSVCEFNTLQCDVNSAEFINSIEGDLKNKKGNPDCIFISLDNDSLNLQTGLILNQNNHEKTPIIIRLSEQSGLSQIIDAEDKLSGHEQNIYAFPLLENTCTPQIILHGTTEILTQELYLTYLENISTTDPDFQHLSWDHLDEEEKEKNRVQAGRICLILKEHDYQITPLHDLTSAILEFDDSNKKLVSMAKMEHALWCKGKLKDGWKHGSKKSVRKKTNPALVSWDLLPQNEKDKNENFIQNLPSLLIKAGYQIEKQTASE
jgi:hypothetical protein